MKKDVIYIDVEDDISSIIDKLKQSSDKIIAFVPPKGTAVLQSVVNLKLLKRAAEQASKQPVIVTSNRSLTALAGGLGFYIAKNLQTKPVLMNGEPEELLEDESVDVGDDTVADPIESAAMAATTADIEDDEVELSPEELESLQSAEEDDDIPVEPGKTDVSKKSKKAAKGDKKKKVPNFDKFRKKLLIFGAIALLLLVIGVLIFGRSNAKITIRAETTPVDVAFNLQLDADSQQSSPETFAIKAVIQESKKTLSQDVTPTGEKDLGTKASGKVTLQNCSRSVDTITIPGGTAVSANNLSFLTAKTVTLPDSTFDGLNRCKTPSVSIPVTAQNNGDQYNLSGRSYEVAGVGSVKASGSQMTGGSSKIVKIVTQADVNKAAASLNQQDEAAIKQELKKAFEDSVNVLEDSFTATVSNQRSEPAVGQEANSAKLTAEATYTMLGAPKEAVGSAIDAFVATKMTARDKQRVYDNGLKDATFVKVELAGRQATYKVSSRAQYGPQFDENALKDAIAKKKVGEARSYLQDLPGVKGVDIHLSPFWARTLPAQDKIKTNIEVDTNSGG